MGNSSKKQPRFSVNSKIKYKISLWKWKQEIQVLLKAYFAFNSGEFMKWKCCDPVFKSYCSDAVQCFERWPITSRNRNRCHMLVTIWSHMCDAASWVQQTVRHLLRKQQGLFTNVFPVLTAWALRDALNIKVSPNASQNQSGNIFHSSAERVGTNTGRSSKPTHETTS